MKILFVTTRWPVPPVTGDRLRSFYILKELSKHHDVTLVAFFRNKCELSLLSDSNLPISVKPVYYRACFDYLKAFRGLFTDKPLQLRFYYSPKMKKIIERELAATSYDLLFSSMIRGAQYFSGINDVPKIVDLIDSISLSYKRILNCPGTKKGTVSARIYNLERKRVLQYEIEVINKFDHALLVSKIDRDFLAMYTPPENVKIVANGVNPIFLRPHENNYDPFRITFHGNIHYYPNTDAVFYFYKKIFPLIKKREPRAKFYIVGNQPRKSVQKLRHDPDVVITGRVDDIRPYLQRTAVSVCPIRMGAGMQNKVLEAMSVGVPVVTTTIGLEGIEANDGEHLLVADDPHNFAEAVLNLLHDKTLRETLVPTAKCLIDEKYTWQRTLSPLLEIFETEKLLV